MTKTCESFKKKTSYPLKIKNTHTNTDTYINTVLYTQAIMSPSQHSRIVNITIRHDDTYTLIQSLCSYNDRKVRYLLFHSSPLGAKIQRNTIKYNVLHKNSIMYKSISKIYKKFPFQNKTDLPLPLDIDREDRCYAKSLFTCWRYMKRVLACNPPK